MKYEREALIQREEGPVRGPAQGATLPEVPSSQGPVHLLCLLMYIPVLGMRSLLFLPEDGGSRIVRNFVKYPPEYAALRLLRVGPENLTSRM
jgi:hypothetical protein